MWNELKQFKNDIDLNQVLDEHTSIRKSFNILIRKIHKDNRNKQSENNH